MQEKQIIEGKRNSTLAIILMVPSILTAVIGLVLISKVFTEVIPWPYVWYTCPNFIFGIIMFVVAGIFAFVYSVFANSKIVVTSRRVYGCAAFGKRVDLPVDSITAVGTDGAFSQIAVSTPSGIIRFYMIKNNAEILQAISDLLVIRQDKPSNVVQQVISQSSAAELKEYKELLDNGIISQEEFDAKKKQLLGM